MQESRQILLSSTFTNRMKIGEKPGWVILDDNPLNGYTWQFIPDNSGTYELIETNTLYPSLKGENGVPGKIVWKFKAIKEGEGLILFKYKRLGSIEFLSEYSYKIEVSK